MKITLIITQLLLAISCYAQHTIEWQKFYGGSNKENMYDVISIGNEYIFYGYTHSSDGDIAFNNGDSDLWIVKVDSNGNILWEKTYGGSQKEYYFHHSLTKDSNFIFAGNTSSNNGDISINKGGVDIWLVEISKNGDIVWERTIGGSSFDSIRKLRRKKNSGYIAVATSFSTDGDFENNLPSDISTRNALVLQLDSIGAMQSYQIYGGDHEDYLIDLIIENDYTIFSGSSSSNSGSSQLNNPFDYWVLKVNNAGAVVWSKYYGGSNLDRCEKIIKTKNNNYLLLGRSLSSDGDISNNIPTNTERTWLVCIDSNGNILWDKSFEEYYNKVIVTTDGGFALISGERGNSFINNLLKLNDLGEIQYKQSFTNNTILYPAVLIQNPNSNYIIGGLTIDSSTFSTFLTSSSNLFLTKLNAIDLCDSTLDIENSIPKINFGNDTILCEGITYNLIGHATDFLWQDNSVSENYLVTDSGTYILKAKIGYCESTDSINIDFSPVPYLHLGNDTFLCESFPYILDVGNGDEIIWQDGSENSTFEVNKQGIYSVKLKIDGCATYDTVRIDECIELEIPNIFTPNNDFINDLLNPIKANGVQKIETKIFNRWGALVFETSDITIDWNANNMPDGIYYYQVDYLDNYNKTESLKGWIQVSR